MDAAVLDRAFVQGVVDWVHLIDPAGAAHSAHEEVNELLRAGLLACDRWGRLVPGRAVPELTNHPSAIFWRVLNDAAAGHRDRRVRTVEGRSAIAAVLRGIRARHGFGTAVRQGDLTSVFDHEGAERFTRLVLDSRFPLSGPAGRPAHPDSGATTRRWLPRTHAQVEVTNSSAWFVPPGSHDGPRIHVIEDAALVSAALSWTTRALALAERWTIRSTTSRTREHAVIELLAQGLTDEAAARKLGVSDRQFRRYVAALEVRFGATSRFQLGLRARAGLADEALQRHTTAVATGRVRRPEPDTSGPSPSSR